MPVASQHKQSAPPPEEIDRNDPRVKKLVYSMYRDLLGGYSSPAAEFIGREVAEDPQHVVVDVDAGVGERIRRIVK